MSPPASNDPSPRSRLALLATMGALHAEPLRYDLACLCTLVADLSPDLLCAEITREAWEEGDMSFAALEVREALAPVVAATDIVLIPVAPSPDQFADYPRLPGWRQSLVRRFDRLLRWGQRVADRPEVIHGMLFETFCHSVCTLTEMAWRGEDRATWEAQNKALAANILQAVQRDAGRRVLVVVQCQRIHKLVPLLERHPDEFELVHYANL